MATRVLPAPTDADNSSGSLPAARSDWRFGDADSMSARTTPESTTDAGYTTAGVSPTANLSISLLPLWGSPYTRIMQILANATNVIAEGEVLQLMNMHDASLDESGYLKVIRSKTAKLFEASAQLGAVLAQTGPAMEQCCSEYGQALGTAFQVIDDVLDYDGDTNELGKNIGDDLREGKATLPLIAAIQRGTANQRQLVRSAIENGSVDQLEEIVAIVRATGALEATRRAAALEATRAVEAARKLPDNLYSQALLQLAAQLLDRRS
jgi:octaprenyl-diphosphate synthase